MRENCSFEIKVSKDVLTEGLAEDPTEEPEEDPEEDPKEESEDDPEDNSADDQDGELEEDLTLVPKVDLEDKSGVKPNEDSADELSMPGVSSISNNHMYDIDTDGIDRQLGYAENHSKEKKRTLAAASDLDPLQVYPPIKKFRQEEAFKSESGLHGKSDVSEVLDDESASKQQEHSGSSGKRRHSMWDLQPEQDVEKGKGDKGSKRRKTRWGSDASQLKMLGPIHLPEFVNDFIGAESDPECQKLKQRLVEVNRELLSLQVNEGRPPPGEGSSPAQLSSNCYLIKNTNKKREKLVKERQRILSDLIKKNPTFKTPREYKPKLFRKLYIPVKEYPSYNFIGLIMGPRGNTQRKMEMETGAKILLRGKGSSLKDKKPDRSEIEDLHVYIEANNQSSLDAAVAMVEKLLIPIDEGMNEFKRAQLEELASLNGSICRVCNEIGHRNYACPNRQSTFEKLTACTKCGSFCHPISRCPLNASPQLGNSSISPAGLGVGSVPNMKGKPKREINEAHLYVGCLPQTIDDNWLRELFCPFGKIIDVKIIKDRSTGLSKGYGFVNFESHTDAAIAVKHMNGYKMEGKMLAVRVAGQPPQAGLSVLNLQPYAGPAAISVDISSHTGSWPAPPGSMLPEPQFSFLNTKGLDLPPSSVSLVHNNHLSVNKAKDILPSAVSSLVDSKIPDHFNPSYGHAKRAVSW